MQGLYINQNGKAIPESEDLGLLARRPGIEVMLQQMDEGASVWLSPAASHEGMEFFYILSGCLRLCIPDEPKLLIPGDSFYTDWLEGDLRIEVVKATTILYITNKPLFDDLSDFQSNLKNLLRQVDSKDNSTYEHSMHVLDYSLKLATQLERCQRDIDDLCNAALFHDIGKCYVPDEILKKPEHLTDEEMHIMKKHPLDSAKLLEPIFGKRVAEIAKHHHEKLDGSGYPNGLKGDELSMESRIIAVADSFDAMTRARVYTKRCKSKLEALEELCSMTKQYDPDVCEALRKLYTAGELDNPQEQKEQ